MYTYEATLDYHPEDKGWFITFPAFDGAFAFGHTIEDACNNAATVLRLFVAEWLDEGRDLPRPAFHEPPACVVSVDVDDAYRARTRCMTTSEAAEELGISAEHVSRLVAKGTLDTAELEGQRYVTIASVSTYKAGRRKADKRKEKTGQS